MKSNFKTSWDLTPLYKSDNDPKIEKDRKLMEKETYRFINKWKNRTDFIKDPKILKEALDEYEYWLKNFGNIGNEGYYFHLRLSQDQNNPKIKANFTRSVDFSNKIQNNIQFFELRIAKIDKNIQKKFLSYKPLLLYKHFLERLFANAQYLLSDPEEKIMNLKALPAHINWVNMVSGFLAKEVHTTLNDQGKKELKNFPQITSLMDNKNKNIRDGAAESFNFILKKYSDVAENEMNSILQDKKVNDELRNFDRPDKSRHVGDDIETTAIDTMIDCVSRHFDISKNFYHLKAKLFGVKKLKYHERNVEYGKIDLKYSYEKALDLVSRVFADLDIEFLSIFESFINQGRIDVYPEKGKRGGASCAYGLLSHPTYALLNYTDKLQDILTMAHELGHGINFELAKKQNSLNFGTTNATTEVASTFMEDFVLKELLKRSDYELRLSLLMMKLNSDISSIFRQVAFYQFEKELHTTFRQSGYLSKEEIGEIFQKHTHAYMGDYVEQSPGSENWWIYVPHFRDFFYVYSYANGLLISKSLQSSLKKNPKFIIKVKEFLSAGLSDSPKNIFAKLGIDITDNNFWESGIEEISSLLRETEKLAIKLNKI